MANFVFNIAKGKVAEYAARVNANDPTNSVLLVVPVATTGLESDATLIDKADLAAVFSGTTDEAVGSTWARKTLDQTASVTITVSNASDNVVVDIPDQTWLAVASSNNVSKLILAYDSDSTTGADSAIIPLTCHDFVVTTDGSDITAQITNFFQAS